MANGRSYTSYFKADSSGFKKGVDDMVKALEKANKELVNNQYRQKDCNKVISDAQKEIKKLEKEQKENGKLDEEQTKKLKALNDTIESEKVKLAQLKTEQAAIKGTISDLSKEIAGNNKEWTTLKATIANLASDGLEALGRKLLEIGKSVIATGEQFTASMSEVGAISGATAEEMELLEQTAREYGATTKFSASESAQALKYMALAGWDTQQSIESLGSVLDLAAAGNMDLARASDIVTDYITAFGLSAQDSSHFVDVMAYAMSNSNTNVEQLGEAYKNCAAGAGAMGYSVEDVTAALMTMANAGIKGGEAGTSLNAVMTRLATDTKGCATALEEYGVYIYDSEGNMKSMSSILESLAQTWQGLTQEEQANLGKMIAGQNQLNAFQTMMAGLSDKAKEAGASFSDYTKALEECDGTSEGMAKTMSDNLSGDLKTMQSAFEELALKIYDSGETPLRDLVKFVTNSVVPALDTLINHMDIIVPIFVAAATAVGSYKAALGIQSIIAGVTQATTALTAAETAETAATEGAAVAQGTLNTVQAANPIGLLVAAIGLLVGGLTAYTAITGQAAESTDEYVKSLSKAEKAIDDCNKQLDSAEDKYADSIANAEANTAQIKVLCEEYETLRTKQNRTAGETAILDSLAEDLAKSMGITTEELIDQNGQYIELNNTIDEYISKLKQKAQTDAAVQLYSDAVKARAKAEQELIQFQKENYELEIRREEIEKKRDAKALGATGITYDDEQDINALEEYDQKLNELNQTVTKAKEVENNYSEAVNDTVNSQEEASETMDLLGANFRKNQEEANKSLEKTTKTTKTTAAAQKDYNKTLKEFQTVFSSDTGTLKSLANQYSSVADGQLMSLDALIQLSLQYPQYSSEILSANGNLEAQKKVLSELFEAKKNDLKATIEQMKAEKQAMEAERDYLTNYIRSLELLKNSGASIDSQVINRLESLKERFTEINTELSGTPDKIKALENAFNSIKNLGINNYSVNTNPNNNYTPSQTYSDPGSTQWTWGWMDEVGTGNTSAAARLSLVERVHQLGKINDKELKAEYEKILREEQLTADESYNIRQKLYSMTAQLRQKDLDLAKAAYEKLVKGQIESYQKASDNIKNDLDKKLKALDDESKKRQQKEEDEKRRKEIRDIEDEIFYNGRRMTQIEKDSLLRRKQDLLNEQAKADYERDLELKKAQLQEQANAGVSKNTQAIERLNKVLEDASFYLAKISGSQSSSQIVNNSTRTQNIQYIAGGFGMSYDQFIRQIY